MNIGINTLRGWLSGYNSNSSRKVLVLSNVFSVTYIDHIQVIANCPIWAGQVKHREKNFSFLSYIFLKERVKNSGNMVPATKNTYTPHTAADINIYMSQDLEPTVILYQEN